MVLCGSVSQKETGLSQIMKVVSAVAGSTAILSAVSWAYRFVDEHMRYEELLFYILVPTIIWLLFAGPLFLLQNRRKAVRYTAAFFLIPTSVLWVISVLIGFYGLKIH